MKKYFYVLLLFCFTSLIAKEYNMAKLNIVASSFKAPTGIAFDSTGSMYVTNWSGDYIDKIEPNGKLKVFFSGISSPAGIVIDIDDNVYVSSYSGNYILKISPNGNSKKISEGYNTPTGIAFSNSGQLLITNRSTGEIISLDLLTSKKSVIAKGLTTPVGVTQLEDNSLVVSQYSGRLTLIDSNGKQKELGDSFSRPGVGIVAVSSNVVAVIDNGAGKVREIDIKTGKTKILAENLSQAVALAFYNNNYYVGTWDDGSVYMFSK